LFCRGFRTLGAKTFGKTVNRKEKVMTQTEFRKSGWSKEFAQFDEAELATILLCVKSLCEIGCWTELVHYCAYRIEESLEETTLEDLDEDSAVVH
jgi:hypothetical protein